MSYRLGIELKLKPTVGYLATTLSLRGEHSKQLTDSAWAPVLRLLDDWGWKPLAPD